MLGTMQVADGVHGVKLDFGEVFVTDPVELGGRVRGGGPRHVRMRRWRDGLMKSDGSSSESVD